MPLKAFKNIERTQTFGSNCVVAADVSAASLANQDHSTPLTRARVSGSSTTGLGKALWQKKRFALTENELKYIEG